MADEPEVVQPDEGQGDGGAQGTPYDEYLSRIPEEVRDQVEPVFKDWDANVTRRFQEAAEYRKQWEPYEQMGVNQVDPSQVAWGVQFASALDNPQAIQQWYEAYAQQHGLTPQEAQAELQGQQEYQDYSEYDPNVQQLEQMLEQRLGPIQQSLAGFQQWQQHLDQQARVGQAYQQIETQLTELEQKHPDEFDRERVEVFMAPYIDTDPENAIRRGFEDYRAFVGQVQKETLQAKVNNPMTAEYGGLVNGAPEQIKTMDDAKAVALAQLRESNRLRGQ